MLLKMITEIPNPVQVIEQESAILTVSLILGSISSVAVIVSAVFAYLQWKKVKYESKVRLVEIVREKIYDDKDVQHILYLIDYGYHWYDEKFHNTEEPQMSVDKTLSIMEYVCYMYNQKILEEKEFELIKYDIDRIAQNHDIQEYLWNLYHWSKKIETRCSFLNFINYSIENKLWEENFRNDKSVLYEKYLNF